LATSPDPRVRNPEKALELAQQLIQLSANNGAHWHTLGVAHYRVGDWKAAIGALEKSLELRKGGDGYDWFVLALAHGQLGQNDEARRWYDKAAQWMDQRALKEPTLQRFRAEAAALLQIDDRPTMTADSK